jgi:hypothetical protein
VCLAFHALCGFTSRRILAPILANAQGIGAAAENRRRACIDVALLESCPDAAISSGTERAQRPLLTISRAVSATGSSVEAGEEHDGDEPEEPRWHSEPEERDFVHQQFHRRPPESSTIWNSLHAPTAGRNRSMRYTVIFSQKMKEALACGVVGSCQGVKARLFGFVCSTIASVPN